jgi:hypothetical protein
VSSILAAVALPKSYSAGKAASWDKSLVIVRLSGAKSTNQKAETLRCVSQIRHSAI